LFGCFAQGFYAYFTGSRFIIAYNDGKARTTGICFFHLRLKAAAAAMENSLQSLFSQVPHRFPGEAISGVALRTRSMRACTLGSIFWAIAGDDSKIAAASRNGALAVMRGV